MEITKDDLMSIKNFANEIVQHIDDILQTKNYTPIETINLSSRTCYALRRKGIKYVEELARLSFLQIIKTRNIGRKSFDEINIKIQSLGYPGWIIP